MDLLSSTAMLGIHVRFQGGRLGRFGDCLKQSGMEKKHYDQSQPVFAHPSGSLFWVSNLSAFLESKRIPTDPWNVPQVSVVINYFSYMW